jgi:5-formyltetrahydrofolate cyclo-ligase
MGEAYEHDKRLIRRRIQASRSRLTAAEVCHRSAAACERALRLPVYTAADYVVAYAAIGNEIDPALIAQHALASGKRVYYPVPGGAEPLFVESPAGEPTVPGGSAELVDAVRAGAEGVLFLVPGLAFDARGARLGRGHGWYDRALARYAGGSRVGLAYEIQIVPHLPEAPWDVRVDAIVTEARLIGEPAGSIAR